nr:reverse transcriptase domain-containing protein [Tanacetum cinerariifolium]
MCTRSSSNLVGESSPNPTTLNLKKRNRRRLKQPFILEESRVDTMANQHTMAELLRAPTEGYAEVIVVPPILAEHFELKHSLINVMTSDQFFGLEKDNPHDHIRCFNKITFTIKYKDVPNSTIKAWDHYKDLLCACPHHGFTELHQLDTFYNALNPADQDSLNSAAGGNILERHTQDVMTIIKNKAMVRNSQNKSIISQVKSSDANSSSSSEIAKLTHAVNQQTSAVTTAMTAILKQFQATPPLVSLKADEEICVTCGGAHPYYQCLAADGNTFLEFWDNIQGYVSAATVNYNQASMSNQTNELKNMMSSFFQMNTASTSGSGPLPSNTIANPKGELKAITTRSGLVLDGPSVPMPPPFINPEEDERAEETLMDPDLAEYTIKVPPPLVQKAKPPSQIIYVQDKDEIQIHKFSKMFKQLHINITLADALILISKYQKMLKALLSNKEKLLELENTPLNENCSAVILKKLPEKLRDPRKFLISCGFSKLKCKALADLGASINLMPLSVWKNLGLPELISTRMTLELSNRAICTPAGIARDVFLSVGKFTFPADFFIVDYESDSRVPLILGRPFLWTARALIDVHGEEMILRDGDERLTLNMRHDTSRYSNQPQKESINMINIYNDSYEDYLEDFTTSSSLDHLLEEFADELALITFPPGNDDLPFDIESDLREIEYLLNHDPTKEKDFILEDSVDEDNLTDRNNDLFDTIPEMFIDEHTLDYSSLPLYDDFDDYLLELESIYFLPSPEYDSFLFEYFFEVNALPSTDNEDKVFNLDFNPPLYELAFHKEVLGPETLLSFSSENEVTVFKPGILTSEGVHTSLLSDLSHRGPKAFKVIKIFKSPMEIVSCSYGEDIRILDVLCLHFYPP